MPFQISGLHLLNGPYAVVDGRVHAIPEGGKRLLVLVALRGAVNRQTAAAVLWPRVDPSRAAGNLRSAAWRLRCADLALLAEGEGSLRLNSEIELDIDVIRRQARRVTSGHPPSDGDGFLHAAISALDLLPGWYEDWVAWERDRLRKDMLDAIDAISIQLSRSSRCAEAIDAALVAVTVDPLRESSQAALIHAHMCENNIVEARRAYASYRCALQNELGLEPSERLTGLVGLKARHPSQTRPAVKRPAPSKR